MNSLAAVALGIAGFAFGLDWIAVHTDRKTTEEVAKTTAIAALIVAALVLSPTEDSIRPWIVGGLSLSLIGDVLLLPRFDRFVFGLASFLLAHIVYVAGFLTVYESFAGLVVGIIAALALTGLLGSKISAAAPPGLKVHVRLYNLAICSMLITSLASGNPAFVAGGVLFCVSDSLLGWGRFIGSTPLGRTGVHITYHLAQAAFVLGLVV